MSSEPQTTRYFGAGGRELSPDELAPDLSNVHSVERVIQSIKQRPGDALRAAGIEIVSPWDFLSRRLPKTQITPNIAAELAAQTGTTRQFWLDMQEAFNGR